MGIMFIPAAATPAEASATVQQWWWRWSWGWFYGVFKVKECTPVQNDHHTHPVRMGSRYPRADASHAAWPAASARNGWVGVGGGER